MNTLTPHRVRRELSRLRGLLIFLACLSLCGCYRRPPSILFTQIPPASSGGPNTRGVLGGKVIGFKQGDRLVLYARSDNQWWIQPTSQRPFTEIKPDGTWISTIHLGMEYGAVVVRGDYETATVLSSLPDLNEHAIAKAKTSGKAGLQTEGYSVKTLSFSGYDWEARTAASPTGGLSHNYTPNNVWLDDKGALHLRVSREGNQWVCAEVRTIRSLGYGSYQFLLRDTGDLEPAAMLGLFTWDDESKDPKHTEMDIHVSRWGNPESKNGEYVIQPYQIPSNVYRFEIPKGSLRTGFRWSPGAAAFSTTHGEGQKGRTVEAWTFTTGIPTPTGERIYVNLCEFGYPKIPLQHGAEVVIDRFQFLP